MNGGYTKLFSSIVTSTVWMEDAYTRVVWITMLAMADREGDVAGSVPGLAHLSGVTVEQCDAALAKFMAPDPRSRTKTDDGRRIEEIDGGWHLLNHAKYRHMASKAEMLERATARKRRYRERLAKAGVDSPALSTPVHEKHAEAEAEAEAEAVRTSPPVGGESDTARDLWNVTAERTGLPKTQTFNKSRRAAVEARLKDLGGLAGWNDMLAKIEGSSPWFRQQFRPGLDWVLKPANLTKIMEGNYDDGPANGSGPMGDGKVRAARPRTGDDAFLERLASIAFKTDDRGGDGS